MRERFERHLKKTFGGLPKTTAVLELKEEILSNLLEKAAECKEKSMTDEQTFDYCVDSLGDYTEAIKALRTSPIDVVKSKYFLPFGRNSVIFALTVLIVYFTVSFATSLWRYTFIIPAGSAVLYAAGVLCYLINTAFTLKRKIAAFVYEFLLAVLLTVALYFIVSYTPAGYARSWLTFTTMPPVLLYALLATQKLISKKASKALFSAATMLLSVSLYLILSVAVPSFGFGKAWIIILGGAAVTLATTGFVK